MKLLHGVCLLLSVFSQASASSHIRLSDPSETVLDGLDPRNVDLYAAPLRAEPHRGAFVTPKQHDADESTRPLHLCECEPATGPPYDLSCQKEGFFISGFEREGQWLAGGGMVPLSRAICCRPCLPGAEALSKTTDELRSSLGAHGDDNATALAIISIGCHKSDAPGSGQLMCETSGSLVTGYAEANRVSAALDAYYPVGGAECCTPSVLMSNGDAYELQHCDCEVANSISCGGQKTDRLLTGYSNWRMTFTTQFVPIAPAKCCKACLGPARHRMQDCADQVEIGMCSGHGVCIVGQCECIGGWHGVDCSQSPSGSHVKSWPGWLLALMSCCSVIILGIIFAVAGRILRHYDILPGSDAGSEAAGDVGEPLLSSLDEEAGSVGSSDTESYDSETEAQIADIATATLGTADASERTAEAHDRIRLESVERLIVESQQRHPDDLDAGIQYAMREMEAIISEAEQGSAEAVAEAMRAVGAPLADTIRHTYDVAAARQARHAALAAAAEHGAEAGGSDGGSHDADTASPETSQPEVARSGAHRDSSAAAGSADYAAELEARNAPQPSAEASNEWPAHTSIEIQAAASSHRGSETEDEPAGTGDEAGMGKAEKKTILLEEGRRQQLFSGPLASLECTVCLNRPIQVVLIPCGHAAICRRCSRRLQRCPVCRKEILRRQRLYVGG